MSLWNVAHVFETVQSLCVHAFGRGYHVCAHGFELKRRTAGTYESHIWVNGPPNQNSPSDELANQTDVLRRVHLIQKAPDWLFTATSPILAAFYLLDDLLPGKAGVKVEHLEALLWKICRSSHKLDQTVSKGPPQRVSGAPQVTHADRGLRRVVECYELLTWSCRSQSPP